MLWDLVVQKACAWLAREIRDAAVRRIAFERLRELIIIPGNEGAGVGVDEKEASPSVGVGALGDSEALGGEQEGREVLVSRFQRGGDDVPMLSRDY